MTGLGNSLCVGSLSVVWGLVRPPCFWGVAWKHSDAVHFPHPAGRDQAAELGGLRPWGVSLGSRLGQPRPQKPAGGCQEASGKAEESIRKRGQKEGFDPDGSPVWEQWKIFYADLNFSIQA